MSRRPHLTAAQDSARRAGAKHQKWRKGLARRDKWTPEQIEAEEVALRAEIYRRLAEGDTIIVGAPPGWLTRDAAA